MYVYIITYIYNYMYIYKYMYMHIIIYIYDMHITIIYIYLFTLCMSEVHVCTAWFIPSDAMSSSLRYWWRPTRIRPRISSVWSPTTTGWTLGRLWKHRNAAVDLTEGLDGATGGSSLDLGRVLRSPLHQLLGSWFAYQQQDLRWS